MRLTNEEIEQRISKLAEGDSNDEEILGLTLLVRELQAERTQASDPVELVGVTIQWSGSFATPDGVTLNAMMDAGEDQCSFTVTSFAMTETEARDQMDQFLTALIKAITPT